MMGGSSNDGEVIMGSTSNHGEVIIQQRKERLCSLTWKQQNVFINPGTWQPQFLGCINCHANFIVVVSKFKSWDSCSTVAAPARILGGVRGLWKGYASPTFTVGAMMLGD